MFDANNDVRTAPKSQASPLNPQPQRATEEFPFWDNESLLAYARRTCTVTVDEFCDMLLAECEKMDREEALMNENNTHREGQSQSARVFA